MTMPAAERAHELVGAPVCPRCGLFALFSATFWPLENYIGEVGRWYAVNCHQECGWRGVARRVREVV